jgi:hypothetical protein
MFWPHMSRPGRNKEKISMFSSYQVYGVCIRVAVLVCTRVTLTLAVLLTSSIFAQSPPQLAPKPLILKLLLLAGTGTEPSFLAMQAFLNQIGIPHDDVVLAAPGKPALPLPPLNDATKGFYQGIILATGNLAVCNAAGACNSALSAVDWTTLDNYATTFGIRVLSYYTYPNSRYGLSPVNSIDTTSASASLTLLPAAATLFPYLNLSNPIPITNAYVYTATTQAAAGEQTTPIMQVNGMTVGVLHTTATGEQFLAITFDNSPTLLHSLALNYGLINWVTKGVFLGARHIYLNPQIDDLFIPNDLYSGGVAGCQPGGFLIDPTVDPSVNCPTGLMSGPDLTSLAAWQDAVRANPQTTQFQTVLAFNGLGLDNGSGAVDLTNPLSIAAIAAAGKFSWVSHTFDHANLDCYDPVPNSGICTQATVAESAAEIDNNLVTARALGLNLDAQSMVTPNISGLTNPNYILAAIYRGVKNLVMDSSTLAANPPPTNTPIANNIYYSVIEIPRRPTSIFYNTTTAVTGVPGSLPDEYNYFYGPQGIFRIGGPGGLPYFTANQTYSQIIDSESNSLLIDMLNYKANPIMFHQSNLIRYDGTHTLYTDLIDATIKKFAQISNLPVISLTQSQMGTLFQQRADYNAAGVQAIWTPGSPATITITTLRPAFVPITGFCKYGCESYGGQVIGQVEVVGQPVTVVSQ